MTLNDGDAILLCSDGLSGYATDNEIESILRSKATVQEIPDQLINFALDEKGSEDNVTVQIVQYGKRKEASGRHKTSGRVESGKKNRRLGRSLAMIISLVLITGISAGVTFFLQSKKMESVEGKLAKEQNTIQFTESQLNELKPQLDTAKSKLEEQKEALATAMVSGWK